MISMIQLSLIFLGSATLKSDMNFISKDEEDVLRCKLMRVPYITKNVTHGKHFFKLDNTSMFWVNADKSRRTQINEVIVAQQYIHYIMIPICNTYTYQILNFDSILYIIIIWTFSIWLYMKLLNWVSITFEWYLVF